MKLEKSREFDWQLWTLRWRQAT